MTDEDEGGRVRTEQRGPVFDIMFDRPARRNALSPQLWEGLERALDCLDALDDVTAVTLSGTGGWFCVGGDLKALKDGTSHAAGEQRERVAVLEHEQAVVRRLVAAPALTIALVEGAATGGGFDLALACDIRVATPDAKLGATYTRIGLVPDLGGLFLLQRAVPHPAAALLALCGCVVDGREAHRLGLVQALAEDGDVHAAAGPFMDAAAAAKPYPLRRVKQVLVREQLARGTAQAAEMALTQSILLDTPEFRAALDRFFTRRGEPQ